MSSKTVLSVFLGLALALPAILTPIAAVAQEAPKVINVLTADTGGDTAKFLEFVKRARAITEQYGGTGQQRAWMATLAGPNTGTAVVTIEYPSMVSMAESGAKIGPSPEWQKFIADFQAAGMRILSNSVSVEITP